MKKVLWISRHEMTQEQRSVSERKATGRFHTLPDGRREQEFVYVHGGWEQLLRMDVRTRRL